MNDTQSNQSILSQEKPSWRGSFAWRLSLLAGLAHLRQWLGQPGRAKAVAQLLLAGGLALSSAVAWAAALDDAATTKANTPVTIDVLANDTVGMALDAIITNYGFPQDILLNDGSGNFSLSTVGGGVSTDVALGDLDGDGDLDAIVANILEPQDILLNDGSGNFSVTTIGGGDSRDVALGDLDGDGDLDAIVANVFLAYHNHEILLNNGSGIFSITTLTARYSLSVALGDLDGDGDLDAVVANRFEPQDILWNDGSAGFSITTLGGVDNIGVALGDLDGDDDLDAVVTGTASNPGEIWLNDGSGGFSLSTFANSGYAVALGDLDGDGDLDAVAAKRGSVYTGGEPHEVWLNDGSAGFSLAATLGGGDSPNIALGDLDGDGDLDAVVANTGLGGAPQDILWNDGSAGFFLETIGGGISHGVDLGDLDGNIPSPVKSGDAIGDDKLPNKGLPVVSGNATLDPAQVQISGGPAHGSAQVNNATGKITYTPTSGFTGTDTLTYTNGLDTAQVTIIVEAFTAGLTAGTTPAEAGPVTGTINISLDAPAPPGGLVLSYTLSGSATAPADFSLMAGTNTTLDTVAKMITLAEGQTSGTVTVVPIDDSDREGDETIKLTLTAGAGYTVDPAQYQAQLTLIDDDEQPELKLYLPLILKH